MEIGESVTQEHMVAEFLKAEIESPEYRKYILNRLETDQRSRSVVDAPDIANPEENNYRAALLSYRGYPNRSLFKGFPRNVVWCRAALNDSDLMTVKYIKYPSWVSISEGTRMASKGAEKLKSGKVTDSIKDRILGTVSRINQHEILPPVILVGRNTKDNLVVLEGHARTTASLMVGGKTLDALIGWSDKMDQWVYY